MRRVPGVVRNVDELCPSVSEEVMIPMSPPDIHPDPGRRATGAPLDMGPRGAAEIYVMQERNSSLVRFESIIGDSKGAQGVGRNCHIGQSHTP